MKFKNAIEEGVVFNIDHKNIHVKLSDDVFDTFNDFDNKYLENKQNFKTTINGEIDPSDEDDIPEIVTEYKFKIDIDELISSFIDKDMFDKHKKTTFNSVDDLLKYYMSKQQLSELWVRIFETLKDKNSDVKYMFKHAEVTDVEKNLWSHMKFKYNFSTQVFEIITHIISFDEYVFTYDR